MRRKTQKTLADLGRWLGLSGCLLALVTAFAWWNAPDIVGLFEVLLERRLTIKIHEQRFDARRETDPVVQRARWLALLPMVAPVGPQDRMADIKKECFAGLSSLAAGSGDFAEAARWMAASVEFDGRDLSTQARLGELQVRLPATRQQGLDHLAALRQRHPSNPIVVMALVDSLQRLDRCAEALDVLELADRAPQSNFWQVLWDMGSDIGTQIAPMLPSVEDGAFRLRFDVADHFTRLRLLAPPFASLTLLRPQLFVTVGDHRRVVDLLGPEVTLHQIERAPGRLEAIGHADTIIDIALPDLPRGNVECTITAALQPRRSSLLARSMVTAAFERWVASLSANDPQGRRGKVREWRRAAFSGLDMEIFWHEATNEFSGERKVQGTIDCPPDGDGWSVTFEVQHAATVLRIDLPQGRPGLCCQLLGIDVTIDGRMVTLDPQTIPMIGLFGCARSDVGFEALDGDPYFVFAVPAGALLERVKVRGML